MMPVRKRILETLLQAWIDEPKQPYRHQRHISRIVGMDASHHLEMLGRNGLVSNDGMQHHEITSDGIYVLARSAAIREQ